jgi:hypothetical protein
MSQYELKSFFRLKTFNGTRYRMRCLWIKSIDGQFKSNSGDFQVIVTTGNLTVKNFLVEISPNSKEQFAYFTTDAFSAMSGNVDVKFGYTNQQLQTISNVNLAAITSPLPAHHAALNAPDATNFWLANL